MNLYENYLEAKQELYQKCWQVCHDIFKAVGKNEAIVGDVEGYDVTSVVGNEYGDLYVNFTESGYTCCGDDPFDVSFEVKIPKEIVEGGDVQAYADELVRKHKNKEEERLNYDFQTIASELIDAWGHDKFKEMVGKFSEKEV